VLIETVSLGWYRSSRACPQTPNCNELISPSVSATHPFQQFILFLLFLLGDYSFISLVMVLVRKRFFRKRCTQLLNNDHFRRTDTLTPQRTGFDPTTFTLTPKGDGPLKPVREKLISSPKDARKVDNFAEDRPVAESPTTHRRLWDDQRVLQNEADPPDETNGSLGPPAEGSSEKSDGKSSAVLSSGYALQSLESPRSRPHGLPHRMLDRERTIQIAEPPQEPAEYHQRQLLRARTRTMSIQDPRSSTTRYDLLHTSTRPVPTQDSIPKPLDPQHSGFGGFPNPLQLAYSGIVSPNAKAFLRRRLSRVETQMTVLTKNSAAEADINHRGGDVGHEENWSASNKHATRWMPERLNGLIVGRNSRFFTEELDDDELQQLGGVEYRALRLLSNIVGGVSRDHRPSAKYVVYHPLPAHPIRGDRHLLLSDPRLGYLVPVEDRRSSERFEQILGIPIRGSGGIHWCRNEVIRLLFYTARS